MNAKVLKTLEFDKIIGKLTSYAQTSLGAQKCRELEPMDQIEDILAAQRETSDAQNRVRLKGSVSFSGARDLRPSIKRLEVGGVLNMTELLHKNGYSRILIYVRTKGESELAYRCSDEIQAIMKKYYPKDSYLVGTTPSTQDIEATITKDYDRVNVLSLIGVFLVVMFSFKSLIIPVIIMIPIEIAIFINMAVPYIAGDTMIFMGYIIVSCIQLGATVDYAILTTSNYLDCRKEADRKQAAIMALNRSIPAVLTSGSILTIVGYTVHFISTVAAIGDLGHLIGRGAVLSMLLVLTLMPAFLVLFDDILMDNEFDRLRRLLRRRKGREAETEESGQEEKCRKQRRRPFSHEK